MGVALRRVSPEFVPNVRITRYELKCSATEDIELTFPFPSEPHAIKMETNCDINMQIDTQHFTVTFSRSTIFFFNFASLDRFRSSHVHLRVSHCRRPIVKKKKRKKWNTKYVFREM